MGGGWAAVRPDSAPQKGEGKHRGFPRLEKKASSKIEDPKGGKNWLEGEKKKSLDEKFNII